MYYRSNNTVLSQPYVWGIDTYKVKSTVEYVMKSLFDKLENASELSLGMKDSAVGYNNSKKYEELEKIYSMAYIGINSLEKNYVEAIAALRKIKKLKDNWNSNSASSFSTKLIEKCREITMQLDSEPFICPTACGSIQFEYENENGDYLEFEIYEDRIEVFLDTQSDGEKEFTLQGISAIDEMKQTVVDFYG